MATNSTTEQASDGNGSGGGYRPGLYLADIIDQRKTILVRYGENTFDVTYRPHVSGDRDFLRMIELAGNGQKLDRDGRAVPADAHECDEIFVDGMVRLIDTWDVYGADGKRAPLEASFLLSNPAMRDDLLDVIWLAVKDDSEVGKAVRRSAESWRSVVR